MGIRTTALAALNPSNNMASATNDKEARVPAEFYLNIGIETDDPQFPFIDLHKSGVALDRVPQHEIRGDADTPWKQFAVTQDALRTAFMDRAAQLAPGETAVVARDEETGICIQIRRRSNNEEKPIVVGQLDGLKFR